MNLQNSTNVIYPVAPWVILHQLWWVFLTFISQKVYFCTNTFTKLGKIFMHFIVCL